MENLLLSRRMFLASACCAAASPLITPVSFAAVPGDRRMVTVVLRGALDGLYLVQPYGDPLLKQYRQDLALDPSQGLIDLDGHFGLHPDAADLFPLWKAGELAIVHAVSTPYRDARSHFDGQDILESGEQKLAGGNTGWMNRALATIPSAGSRKAIDINASSELILTGPNKVDVWSTRSDLSIDSDEVAFFNRLYRSDPPFARAFSEAVETDADADSAFKGAARDDSLANIGQFTAGMLKNDYRIANFSINGWDTHIGQQNVFKRPLKALVRAITELKSGLGPEIWSKTAVLAVTEFGRTARQNGSKGTDHGTGGIAIIAGGAIRGGKVYGQWPGLKENQLFENRDLMATGDVREVAASLLYSQFDISASDLTSKVFPGLGLDLRSQGFLKG